MGSHAEGCEERGEGCGCSAAAVLFNNGSAVVWFLEFAAVLVAVSAAVLTAGSAAVLIPGSTVLVAAPASKSIIGGGEGGGVGGGVGAVGSGCA